MILVSLAVSSVHAKRRKQAIHEPARSGQRSRRKPNRGCACAALRSPGSAARADRNDERLAQPYERSVPGVASIDFIHVRRCNMRIHARKFTSTAASRAWEGPRVWAQTDCFKMATH
eukprot:6212640-Pleurochrysis_carterae.AAC.4